MLRILATRCGSHAAAGVVGMLWKQIVATLFAQAVFLVALYCAVPLRALRFRRALR